MDASSLPGQPVTRVEVLSPAIKAGGSHATPYLVKRHQSLWAASRYYRDVAVDYTQDPPAVELYHPADQERIRARLAAIRAELA